MQTMERPTEQEQVELWRQRVLLKLFPDIDPSDAITLACSNDGLLLEKAKRLADGGCPANLAVRILA